MELPVAAIRGQIVSGIDIFIHLGRLRDKSRKVLEIAEIEGMKDGEILLNVLYQFVETKEVNGRIEGRWKNRGNCCIGKNGGGRLLNLRQIISEGAIAATVNLAVAVLFYDSVYGMVLFPLIYLLVNRYMTHKRNRKPAGTDQSGI